ncbi:unnamed protein product, partial [Symbiodinium microadriaticum]
AAVLYIGCAYGFWSNGYVKTKASRRKLKAAAGDVELEAEDPDELEILEVDSAAGEEEADDNMDDIVGMYPEACLATPAVGAEVDATSAAAGPAQAGSAVDVEVPTTSVAAAAPEAGSALDVEAYLFYILKQPRMVRRCPQIAMSMLRYRNLASEAPMVAMNLEVSSGKIREEQAALRRQVREDVDQAVRKLTQKRGRAAELDADEAKRARVVPLLNSARGLAAEISIECRRIGNVSEESGDVAANDAAAVESDVNMAKNAAVSKSGGVAADAAASDVEPDVNMAENAAVVSSSGGVAAVEPSTAADVDMTTEDHAASVTAVEADVNKMVSEDAAMVSSSGGVAANEATAVESGVNMAVNAIVSEDPVSGHAPENIPASVRPPAAKGDDRKAAKRAKEQAKARENLQWLNEQDGMSDCCLRSGTVNPSELETLMLACMLICNKRAFLSFD